MSLTTIGWVLNQVMETKIKGISDSTLKDCFDNRYYTFICTSILSIYKVSFIFFNENIYLHFQESGEIAATLFLLYYHF